MLNFDGRAVAGLVAVATLMAFGCAQNRQDLVKAGSVVAAYEGPASVDVGDLEVFRTESGTVIEGMVKRPAEGAGRWPGHVHVTASNPGANFQRTWTAVVRRHRNYRGGWGHGHFTVRDPASLSPGTIVRVIYISHDHDGSCSESASVR